MCYDMLGYVPFLSFSGSECDAGHSVHITALPTGGQFYNMILMFLTVREHILKGKQNTTILSQGACSFNPLGESRPTEIF